MLERIGPYRILKELGRGGKGTVYKVHDTRLERICALKILDEIDTDESESDLLEEARAAAAVNHPHVATVFGVEKLDGFSLLLEEWVPGEDLARRLRRDPPALPSILDLAVSLASALEACHASGLAHGDLKPSNVVITPSGGSKLVDFGLARRSRISSEASGSREINGTLPYLAPERLSGHPVSTQSDLYSLGVVLFELLTGHLPFKGGTAGELVQAIRQEDPPPLSFYRDDLSLDWEEIIRRLLAKHPGDRYPDASRLLRDLLSLRERMRRLGAAEDLPGFESRGGFRALLSYQEAESDLFFGRSFDTDALLRMIFHGSLGTFVLFGESGCGKTSLVRAGLVPRLWEQGWVPVYLRSNRPPQFSVPEELERISLLSISPGEKPVDYLNRVSREMQGTILLIFDQFEEFFIRFRKPEERRALASLVRECRKRRSPVKFLFSIRSDFLYRVNTEFAEVLPDPLQSSRLYHLRHLDRRQAQEVLEKTFRQSGFEIEGALEQALLDDLHVDGV